MLTTLILLAIRRYFRKPVVLVPVSIMAQPETTALAYARAIESRFSRN